MAKIDPTVTVTNSKNVNVFYYCSPKVYSFKPANPPPKKSIINFLPVFDLFR